MAGVDRAVFGVMFPRDGDRDARSSVRQLDLVAEGDALVARLTSEYTLVSAEKISGRGLTDHGFANGKVVEDDPITTLDDQWLLIHRARSATSCQSTRAGTLYSAGVAGPSPSNSWWFIAGYVLMVTSACRASAFSQPVSSDGGT